MAKALKGVVASAAVAPSQNAPLRSAADPFRRLGLYGLGGIAPVLVAALATEEPKESGSPRPRRQGSMSWRLSWLHAAQPIHAR